MQKEIMREYDKQGQWENYEAALSTEWTQSVEEGKDIEIYKNLFDAVDKMPFSDYKHEIADVLFRLIYNAPQRADFPFEEPDGIEEIRALRNGYKAALTMPEENAVRDKMRGGWKGRACGCYLGRTVEGLRSDRIEKLLKAIGDYPMTDYIDKEKITKEIEETVLPEINWPAKIFMSKDNDVSPVDDDTTYTVTGYVVVNDFGKNFTSANVASVFDDRERKNMFCTAERVAYRNFMNGYKPPYSAVYKNPYREWIGAQIRADFYGYVNPCDPETAADMAWRDARVTHVKNGIYGEMWVAAMIAAAFGTDDIEEIILTGLGQIPKTSRFYKGVYGIVEGYRSGLEAEELFDRIHSEWDEYTDHGWTHTIPNAEIVAICLLYGKKDYANSVCMAVQHGYDTDCNGATVGSILGVLLGFDALPERIAGRLGDTYLSAVHGLEKLSIKEMAEKTYEIYKTNK